MRKIAIAIAAAALLTGSALQAREKLTPEQELAKLLEGREAGKPVSCISDFETRDMRIIDKTAIVFGSGSVIYVNRPRNPEVLDDDDILVSRRTGPQLCRLDSVTLHEHSGFWYNGYVALEDFVPYRRVAKAD